MAITQILNESKLLIEIYFMVWSQDNYYPFPFPKRYTVALALLDKNIE